MASLLRHVIFAYCAKVLQLPVCVKTLSVYYFISVGIYSPVEWLFVTQTVFFLFVCAQLHTIMCFQFNPSHLLAPVEQLIVK